LGTWLATFLGVGNIKGNYCKFVISIYYGYNTNAILIYYNCEDTYMSEHVEVVQVRMREDTLEQLDKLKTIVKAASRSEALRRAVGITDILVDAIIHGDKVILEKKNGKQTQILITGLNR
jgi:hypothetical protein